MAILVIFLYMALVVLICATVVFAGVRQYLLGRLQAVTGFITTGYRGLTQGTRDGLGKSSSATSRLFRNTLNAIQTHRILVGCATLAIIVPVSLIILFRSHISAGSIAENTTQDDSVIQALLAGEQLVPPPPVPSEVFTTAEVVAVRPALASASRDWNLLNPNFEQRLLHVFQKMHDRGYDMVLIEGYRSPERQDALAAQGSNVTNAKAFQSYHQFGLAGDCAFMRNGKVVISEKDPWVMQAYQAYGEEAEAIGLVWGGRWKMMDLGHVELHIPHAIPGKV